MTATAITKSKPTQNFVRADVAAKYIFSKTKLRPRIGVVLGSGLGGFANEIAGATRIEYRHIPNFPRSTAIGHAGRLVIGKVSDVPVAVMQGRVHMYEGYSPQEVVFPMRVMARMGIRAVLLTNAAGGINTSFSQGCLVVLRDHINLQGTNPLIGPNDERFGERFPDMTRVYWKPYQAAALEEGKRLGMEIAQGVYAALTGPSYGPDRDVHRTGSDCRGAHGNSRAGNFLRHEYGGGNSRSADYHRRSDGNGRTGEGGFCGAAASRGSAHE
jgi:purine-nucleoside phosphorylase